MLNHSYENEFNLHANEISFSYEKMGTKTRFEEEAKGNSEMAYYSYLIVSITKFSIGIGIPSVHLSRNRRTITWVSSYWYPFS